MDFTVAGLKGDGANIPPPGISNYEPAVDRARRLILVELEHLPDVDIHLWSIAPPALPFQEV